MGFPSRRCSSVVAILLISITTLIIYSNTFTSPFHFDDIPNIVEDNKIREISNFLDVAGTRYIGDLTFALNYHFGGLNVFGYHLVNIAIHILNGILVWWLVVLTLRIPMIERFGLDAHIRGFIAMASSMVFAVHPIQTQAVTYIIQRYTSLATLFYLLSIVLFVRWRLSSSGGTRVFFYLFSILSAVLAMKTKEISFTLPFVIFLYEYSFFRERWKIPYHLIPILITLVIIPLTRIGLDIPHGDMFGALQEVSQETENISRGDYLLTQFRVIVTYIRLLFLPVNQNLDYDYPIYHSLFTPGVFLSFLFLLLIFCLAVYFIVRSRKDGNAYLLLSSFGILWFFITLSVESSLIPIKDVIFEHRLYLPGVGIVVAFSSAVAWGVEYTRKRLSLKFSSILVIVLIIMILPLSVATYHRNQVWKDEVALWTDVVKKSPEKARGYDNLGVAYYQQGQINEAIKEYKTAIRLDPNSHDAHYDLAVAYNKQGRIDDAVEEFNTTLRLKPNIAEIHYNLGLVYSRHGRIDEAIKAYTEALRLKPDHAGIHHDLGFAYARQGRIDEAIEQYIAALRLKPDFAEARNHLGLLYKGLQKQEVINVWQNKTSH